VIFRDFLRIFSANPVNSCQEATSTRQHSRWRIQNPQTAKRLPAGFGCAISGPCQPAAPARDLPCWRCGLAIKGFVWKPQEMEGIAGGGTRTLTGLTSLRIFVPLWLSPPLRFVVWTFPWPWVAPVGLSRQVSTPSPAVSAGAWLGIAATIRGRAAVPPTSTEFTRRVSHSGAQISLSPMRLPIPPLQRRVYFSGGSDAVQAICEIVEIARQRSYPKPHALSPFFSRPRISPRARSAADTTAIFGVFLQLRPKSER